jgi:hypothetical protein
MGSLLICINKDYKHLPRKLLPYVKEHLRVEFARDDGYIEDAIARAIDEVEAATDLSIHYATWKWTLPKCGRLEVPKTPVRELRLPDGTLLDENLVEMFYGGPDEPGKIVLKSGLPYEWVHLDVGYAEVAQIPPRIITAIFSLTGDLYENREAVTMGSYSRHPELLRRMLTGLWRPSV